MKESHPAPGPRSGPRLRFGAFELDLRAAEIRKHGLRMRLPQQSFQVLLMLVESPGEVVLREEIRQKLWPNDTVVEFDHSINAAVQKLRETLGESAEQPRFIETVARRGYRFIGTMEAEPGSSPNPSSPIPSPAAVPLGAGFSPENPGRSAAKLAAWAIVVAGLLVAAAVLAMLPVRKPPQPPLVRYTVPLPPGARFSDYAYPVTGYPVVSPDGERIAIALAPSCSDVNQIWIYHLSSGEFRPMTGTNGAFEIAWSPNSGSLVYWANGKYQRLTISDGAISTLLVEPRYGRSAITPNGDLLLSAKAGLELVSAKGEHRQVTSRTADDPFEYFPALLPGGARFLFVQGVFPPIEIWKGRLDGGARTRLFSADSQAEYSDSGHLLFVRGNTLFAQAFDLTNAVTSGPAQPLVNGVARLIGSSLAGFSESRNGVLAYRPGAYGAQSRLTWLDRTGKQIGTLGDVADYYNPEFSPDGKRVAVMIRDPHSGKRGIWIFDLTRGSLSRLTVDPSDHINPTWSPDGERIAFTSNRKGTRDLYIAPASGGPEEVVFESKRHKSLKDWSADGRFLLFSQIEQEAVGSSRPSASTQNQSDIYLLPLSVANRKPVPFLTTPFREDSSRISPDGRWIAYRSYESGSPELFVQSFPANGKKYQISVAGGGEPRWRGDSKELFYVTGTSVMAVEICEAGAEAKARRSPKVV